MTILAYARAALDSSGLKTIGNSLWWRSSAIAIAAGTSDFVWARYISTIGQGHALSAANWGVIVIVLGAFVVVSYVEDKRLIIPAAIGAWIGTYLAV